MSKSAKNGLTIRKEIDVDLLDSEDRAVALHGIMSLRAQIDHIRGHGTALHGLRSCGNELLNLSEMELELEALADAVVRARVLVERLRKYETQCVG